MNKTACYAKVLNRTFKKSSEESIVQVFLKLYADLMQYMPDKNVDNPWVVDVDEYTTVIGLLKGLNIPLDRVKIIFLNNLHAKGDEALKDQDRLGVFPLVAGG